MPRDVNTIPPDTDPRSSRAHCPAGQRALGAGGGGERDGRLRAHGSPRRPALVAHAVGQRQPHARDGRCQRLILRRTPTISTCDAVRQAMWSPKASRARLHALDAVVESHARLRPILEPHLHSPRSSPHMRPAWLTGAAAKQQTVFHIRRAPAAHLSANKGVLLRRRRAQVTAAPVRSIHPQQSMQGSAAGTDKNKQGETAHAQQQRACGP